MTHTYAELEVSAAAYDEIKSLLKDAGYDHAFIDGAIDMHGIGLVKKYAPEKVLTTGAPVPEDGSHKELKTNGQQRDYVVLSAEERAKGFVRPVRHNYRHVGKAKPANLRPLTEDEIERYGEHGYVMYEKYPEEMSPKTGRFWTKSELAAVENGCQVVTTMSEELAETYARKPDFYSGTFCCGCQMHFPVDQFVWEGTDERVGS